MSRSIEQQRRRALRTFLLANLIQDTFILIGNVAVAVQGFSQAVISSWGFVKFDAARKYRDIAGADLGEAVGCPGHFTGECHHAAQAQETEE